MVRFKNQNVAETRARNELCKFSFEIVGILKIYDDHVDENVSSNFALSCLSRLLRLVHVIRYGRSIP